MPSTDSHWEAFGKVDPYYGVLTDPKYRKVKSDEGIRDEFFSTGSRHVEGMLAVVERYLQSGFAPGRVLDFGCGVGRLTIPLSQRADEVVGVDVSDSMLAEARRNCDRAGAHNVALVKSDDQLSEVTGTFDLIHSFIVFQHIPPARGTALFSAMLPRLAEGGIGILHFTYWIPNSSSPTVTRRIYAAARTEIRRAAEFLRLLPRRSRSGPIMEMNAYDIGELLRTLQDSGCHRIHLRFTDHGGPRGVVMFFQKDRLPSM